jgi:hypothetical protein
MIVFGGVTNNLMLLNDVWQYSPLSNSWKELGEGATVMDRPTPREGSSMVVADNDLNALVFGGIGYGYVPYNDVWRFVMKTETWELLEIIKDKEEKEDDTSREFKEPTVPPPRWMHTAASVKGKQGTEMYVFGGCSGTFAPMDDLWRFDVKGKKWENMMGNRRMLRPSGRWLHSASVLPIDEQNGEYGVVVYGGGVNNQPMDDLWFWNTKEKEWEEMHPFTDRPFARAGHTLVSVIKDTVVKETELNEGGVSGVAASKKLVRRRRRRRRMLGMMPAVVGGSGSSDVFAQDGPQQKVEVDHDAAVTPDEISNRRPTTVADEFLFLFGGMSERGLGASSTKGGLGPDPQYPLD